MSSQSTVVTYEEFLSRLAGGPTEAPPSQVGWAQYQTENPYFVPPNLSLDSTAGPDSPVILLSAPGAVGKTTFAEAVAYRQRAPVFDLAGRRVGTDAFLGLIGNAFGYENVSEIYSKVKKGEFLLVVDALDETRVGSGLANFEGFLEDLADHFKGHRSTPSLVLLARVETADLIAVALEIHDVAYSRYSLTLFDEAAAKEFIDKYLDARSDESGRTPQHRRQRGPFESVRDKLFTLLKTAAGEDRAMDLLGYAPVLVALAARLFDESNYQALESSLDRFESHEAWNVLAALAKDLLEREQREKFLKQLSPDLVGEVPDALGPDEQCYWMLLEYLGMEPRLSTPGSVPRQLLSDYEDSVAAQMSEHPFRQGRGLFQHSVFREYVLGWFIASFPDSQDSLRQEVRLRLASQENLLPGPLLARFALGLAPASTGTSPMPVLSAQDLGFVYESISSQADKERRAWLLVDSDPASNHLRAALGVGSDRIHGAEFQLHSGERGLWFWRHLSHAEVRVPFPVVLGVQGGEFVIGPDVEIDCSEFGCPARDLFVQAENAEQSVALVAGSCADPSQPTIRGKVEFLSIHWPQASYPWIRYRPTESPLRDAHKDMLEAYTHLARILTRLRARGYGDIARHKDVVELITGSTPLGRAMLDYCLQQGLIRRDGALFVLDDAAAAKFGINWVDLRRRVANERVRDFISGFLRTVDVKA